MPATIYNMMDSGDGDSEKSSKPKSNQKNLMIFFEDEKIRSQNPKYLERLSELEDSVFSTEPFRVADSLRRKQDLAYDAVWDDPLISSMIDSLDNWMHSEDNDPERFRALNDRLDREFERKTTIISEDYNNKIDELRRPGIEKLNNYWTSIPMEDRFKKPIMDNWDNLKQNYANIDTYRLANINEALKREIVASNQDDQNTDQRVTQANMAPGVQAITGAFEEAMGEVLGRGAIDPTDAQQLAKRRGELVQKEYDRAYNYIRDNVKPNTDMVISGHSGTRYGQGVLSREKVIELIQSNPEIRQLGMASCAGGSNDKFCNDISIATGISSYSKRPDQGSENPISWGTYYNKPTLAGSLYGDSPYNKYPKEEEKKYGRDHQYRMLKPDEFSKGGIINMLRNEQY